MTKSSNSPQGSLPTARAQPPNLHISKLGIVSRDYRHEYENGYRDFSKSLPGVLKLLDEQDCDAAIFSLFSVVPRRSFNLRACFRNLRKINAVMLEEFHDGTERCARRFVVWHKTNGVWQEYEFEQVFGTLTGMKEDDIHDFVKKEVPRRVMGNCCVLLCGESNGVKYSPKDRKVHDPYGLASAISKKVEIILNPIHDRMTRFEMKLKREFLSKNNRWVVSVWNKGKVYNNGLVRNENRPAWTIFRNGEEREVEVPLTPDELEVEIGVLDIGRS